MNTVKLKNVVIGALFFSMGSFSYAIAQAPHQKTQVCLQAFAPSHVSMPIIDLDKWQVGCPTGPNCGKEICKDVSASLLRGGIKVFANDASNNAVKEVCSYYGFSEQNFGKYILIKLYDSKPQCKNNNKTCCKTFVNGEEVTQL